MIYIHYTSTPLNITARIKRMKGYLFRMMWHLLIRHLPRDVCLETLAQNNICLSDVCLEIHLPRWTFDVKCMSSHKGTFKLAKIWNNSKYCWWLLGVRLCACVQLQCCSRCGLYVPFTLRSTLVWSYVSWLEIHYTWKQIRSPVIMYCESWLYCLIS